MTKPYRNLSTPDHNLVANAELVTAWSLAILTSMLGHRVIRTPKDVETFDEFGGYRPGRTSTRSGWRGTAPGRWSALHSMPATAF